LPRQLTVMTGEGLDGLLNTFFDDGRQRE
jgi:hypothetical protein